MALGLGPYARHRLRLGGGVGASPRLAPPERGRANLRAGPLSPLAAALVARFSETCRRAPHRTRRARAPGAISLHGARRVGRASISGRCGRRRDVDGRGARRGAAAARARAPEPAGRGRRARPFAATRRTVPRRQRADPVPRPGLRRSGAAGARPRDHGAGSEAGPHLPPRALQLARSERSARGSWRR